MTKRQVLLAICESPGWQPAQDSSSIDRHLHELQREGWVCPRLDGYEATPQALDAYPRFEGQDDIRDPTPARHPEAAAESNGDTVPIERVVTMLSAMLYELPLAKVIAIASITPGQLPPQKATWELARELAQKMRT